MRVLCAAMVLGLSSVVAADVVYDNITGNPFVVTSVPPPSDEFAGHTRLAAGANLLLQTVELWLRNVSQASTYNAPVWVGLYTEAGNSPGTLFAERTGTLVLGPGGITVFSLDFSGVTAPTASFWTSFKFAEMNPYFLGIGDDRYPTVGSTSGWSGRRQFGSGGAWTMGGPNKDTFGFRITSVPAPAAAAVLGVGVLVIARRRRT